jgi:hypothetical protein
MSLTFPQQFRIAVAEVPKVYNVLFFIVAELHGTHPAIKEVFERGSFNVPSKPAITAGEKVSEDFKVLNGSDSCDFERWV